LGAARDGPGGQCPDRGGVPGLGLAMAAADPRRGRCHRLCGHPCRGAEDAARGAGICRYQPRPPCILDGARTVVYYLYAALATLALGLWGLPQVLVRPERAHRVASLWLGQMLGAARLILGVRVEYRGTPPAGDCIVASKHQSFLDILALAHACPRRAFVMKREVLRVPIMGWFARKVGCIPIDRARG